MLKKYTSLSLIYIMVVISLLLCGYIPKITPKTPRRNTFWIQNKSSHTYTHLYVIPSEEGDADDEFEDDGTDHCKTSCKKVGNENNEFDPDEVIEVHIGKGKYDLMLKTKEGKQFVEDDIEYHDNANGISEERPFVIENEKLKPLN
jgi:hypothetical protein